MKITINDLERLDACDDGIEAFSRTFKGGIDIDGWTATHQALMLGSELREFWGWAVAEGLIPAWSMYGWDLRGARLSYASLDIANLNSSKLDGANLNFASLNGSRLNFASLDGASLNGASLNGASLNGASRLPSDPKIEGWDLVNGRLLKSK